MSAPGPAEYHTWELVELTGVTVRQVQWWHEHRIIKPHRRTGMVLWWNDENRAQVAFIAEARRHGLWLRRVKALWKKHRRDVLDLAPRQEAYLVAWPNGSRFEYTATEAIATATAATGAVVVIPVRRPE